MKIAIFSDNFSPEISGISDSLLSLAKNLGRLGHRIVFYVPRYSRRDFAVSNLNFRELDLGENIEIFRLPSIPYPAAPTKQGRLVLPVLSSYRHIKKFDPDIIYTNLFFGAGIEALLLSRILRKPLVGTNHTPIKEFVKYAPIRAQWLETASVKYVNWYYRHCVLVSAPCCAILSEMKEFGFHSESFALSNPLELSSFSPAASLEVKNRLKQKFGLSPHSILYTGRLAKEKNIDKVLRAMAIAKKSVPDISFAVTGHGAEESNLRRLAEELGIGSSVKFLGYLDLETLADAYRASDAFVVMSTAETQCLGMMNAFASGIPVIAADAYGLPEYVPKDAGFVVDPENITELSERIVYLLSHPEEANRLGRNGKNFVKEFSASLVSGEWERIFRNILGGGTPKDSKPDLSIVIPAYNEEGFIERSLRTVSDRIRESGRNVEIIVVNNASTDRTREIAGKFPGIIIVDEPLKGLPRARQAGFLASRSDLIANIDADSLVPEGWIDTVFREFSMRPDLVALSGPYTYYDIKTFTNTLIRIYYFAGLLFHLFNHRVLRSGAMIQGGNFVLKRAALERIGGFDVGIAFFGEDTDIARRIQREGRVRFTFDLPMRTSGRRLNRDGVFFSAVLYVANHFWVLFFKRPFTKSFRDIR